MKCAFCGYEFEEIAARHQCQKCLRAGGCRSIRCPRCSYEMPEEPKVFGLLSRWTKRLMSIASDKVNLRKAMGVAMPQRSSELSVGNSECRLAEMQAGQIGTVTRIDSGKGNELQKFLALGVLPGATVHLMRKSPSFVFQVGFSEFAVDSQMADAIFLQIAS